MNDYYAASYANVHAASHGLIAAAIIQTHNTLVQNMGEENALDVLNVLISKIVDEKAEEQQQEGALNFLSELKYGFVGGAYAEKAIALIDVKGTEIYNEIGVVRSEYTVCPVCGNAGRHEGFLFNHTCGAYKPV